MSDAARMRSSGSPRGDGVCHSFYCSPAFISRFLNNQSNLSSTRYMRTEKDEAQLNLKKMKKAAEVKTSLNYVRNERK